MENKYNYEKIAVVEQERPDEDIHADGGVEYYDTSRPQPGYQGRSTFAGAPKSQLNRRWYILEPSRRVFPRREQATFRREVETRTRALYSPRYGYTYPAYMRFLGSSRDVYPQDYALMYGSGPRSDHYYPGLTPKDVVLAKSSKRGLTKPGFGMAHEPLRSHEVMQSRKALDSLTAIFYEGYLPSNEDLYYFIDNMVRALQRQVQEKELAPETYRILEDVYNLAIVVTEFIDEVNYDELLQNLIHHSVLAGRTATEQAIRAKKRSRALGLYEEEEEKRKAGHIVFTLIQMIFSKNFKRAIDDLQEILNGVAGETGAGGYNVGFEGGRISAGGTTEAEEIFGQGVQSVGGSNVQEGQKTYTMYRPVYADGGEESHLVEQMGYERGEERRERLVREETESRGTEGETTRRVFREVYETTSPYYQEQEQERERAFDRGLRARVVQEEGEARPIQMAPRQQQKAFVSTEPEQVMYRSIHREHAGFEDFAARLRQPMRVQETMKIVERIRRFLRDMQHNPDVKNSIDMISETILELGNVPSSREHMTGFETNILHADANRRAMMKEIKTVLERFANGHRLDRIIAIVDDFQVAYSEDWILRNFLVDAGVFFNRSLTEPNYMDGADFMPRATDLIVRGRELFGSDYAQMTNAFVNEVLDIWECITSNPLLQELVAAAQRFWYDLAVNPRTGDYMLKKSVMQDIRHVYLPVIMQSLRYIPLPRIEFSDDNWDFAMDNIVLAAENIIPTLIEFKTENQVQVSPRPDLPDAYFLNVITIDIVQIQADVRNVEFAYRKKTFPKTEDSGLADLLLAGNGLSFHIKVAYDPNLWYTTLIPMDIDASIDTLQLKLHDSGNDVFYKIIGPTVVSSIKKRLCRSMEEQIFNIVRKMDGILTNMGQTGGKKTVMGMPLISG